MLQHVRVLGFRFCLLRFVPFQPFNEYRFILFHLRLIPQRLPRALDEGERTCLCHNVPLEWEGLMKHRRIGHRSLLMEQLMSTLREK